MLIQFFARFTPGRSARLWMGLLLAGAAGLLAACQPEATAAPGAWAVTANPAPEGFTATLSAAGAPRPGDNTLDLYLTDANGRPVKDAAVMFDLDMTNMRMGTYVVEAAGDGQGHYQANVRFSMGGPWRLIATITQANSLQTPVRFDFPVRP